MQRTLLITGASSGIGHATAMLAAERGYRVAVHYRARRDAAERFVTQLTERGKHAIAVGADLRIEREVIALYQRVTQTLGPLDAVVNSAGIAVAKTQIEAIEASALHALLDVNVAGLVLSCREAVRCMARSRGGRGGVIVNVSSMAATIGGRPGSAMYAASKAAVDAFTVGLAKEVAAEGIRAVSVRPGMVETEMTREALSDPGFAATVRASIPLGRAARVDEVAAPIVWLLSDDASFVSGACIDVSGGGFHITAS